MTTQDLSGRVRADLRVGPRHRPRHRAGDGRARRRHRAARYRRAEVDTVAAEIEALWPKSASRRLRRHRYQRKRRLWCAPPSPHSATSMCSSTMPVFPAARLPSKQLTRRPMTGCWTYIQRRVLSDPGCGRRHEAAPLWTYHQTSPPIAAWSATRSVRTYFRRQGCAPRLTKAWARELAPYGILVKCGSPGGRQDSYDDAVWNGATSRGS